MKINTKVKKSIVLTVAAASILITALTMAYFVSSDTVTNRLNAQHPSIVLLEPEWDKTGQFMAARSEPGMNIPKDPYAKNDGKVSEYCRIKMTVTVADDSNPLLEGSKYNRTDKERLYSIVNAIFWNEDNTEKFIEINDDLTITKLNNPSFKLASFDSENNPDANGKYDAGSRSVTYYFYYTEGNDTMQIRYPDEETAELFNYINIPVYKDDYLGVFDLRYQIDLQAEILPASLFETNGVPTPDVFYQNITETT